jgi:galactokinase/mevalonate kinase-like predicted kinase
VSGRVAQATVPGFVDLAGGSLGRRGQRPAGSVCLGVAIDRRASCRVETGVAGVRIHAKDTLEKVEGSGVPQLRAHGVPALVLALLRRLGIETGVNVETQSRLPAGVGLGGSSALAVAVAAAIARASGRDLGDEALARIACDAESEALGVDAGIQGHLLAIHGGVAGVRLEPGGARLERLAVDPAVVEESLILVDSGVRIAPGVSQAGPGPAPDDDEGVREALAEIARVAAELRLAFEQGRIDGVAALIAREWEARKRLGEGVTTPEIDRIVATAAAAGGAGTACDAGGGIVAVWARPGLRDGGARERVLAALREAGARSVPFRVDLRGLELE